MRDLEKLAARRLISSSRRVFVATAEVSRILMAAFVAFARTGNPNNARMPEWKPYDSVSRATMTIDVKCRSVNDFHGADRVAGSELRLDPFNRAALLTYKD